MKRLWEEAAKGRPLMKPEKKKKLASVESFYEFLKVNRLLLLRIN